MATKKKATRKRVTKKAASKKATAPKKKSAKKAAANGVTLTQLADEAKITGQKARQKLRAAGIEREKGSRWVFTNKTDEKAARKALGL